MGLLRRWFSRRESKGVHEAPSDDVQRTGVEKAPAPQEISPPTSACPYCGTLLERPPARSGKCPHCGERVVVRTRRTDGAKLLLTQAQAVTFDAERAAIAERNKALRRAEAIGATLQEFERMELELGKRWRTAAKPRDVFWHLASTRVLAALEASDWHALHMVYSEQARLLYEEGKPHFRLHQEASKALIRSYAGGSVVTELLILGAQVDPCPLGEGLNEKRYTIKRALDELPIPGQGCACGWCTCTWLPMT